MLKLMPPLALISAAAPAKLPDPALNPSDNTTKPKGFYLWIQRLKLGIDVVFFIELGMILLVIPWTNLWTQNSLLFAYPTVKMVVDHGFFRGAISGLGLINIWIGISDAVNYRE